MEKKYIKFTMEGLFRHLFFYLIMLILFGGTAFLMIVNLNEIPSHSRIKGIALLITLIPLFFFGFFTLNFLKKLFSMFGYAAILSSQGITFHGKEEIYWTSLKTATYHYDDGEERSDSLFLTDKTGVVKWFDISETDICYESPAYREEIMNFIQSHI